MSDVPEPTAYEIVVCADPEALASEAANRFVTLAREAAAAHGRFRVALSGGSTPAAMQRLLAAAPRKQQVDWQRVHIFWGDERFVPPAHMHSTLRVAQETLLNHVPIPPSHVYPVPTAGVSPDEAAAQYAQSIHEHFFPAAPRFDLIILGMGPDGHTASLFPGDEALTGDDGRLVTAVTNAPKPPPTRITFTYPLLNQAAHVMFLVAGEDKAQTAAQVLAGAYDPHRYPAQGVHPANGRLVWLLDQAAAQDLQN